MNQRAVWYQEPWVLFNLGLLLTAMVCCTAMTLLAVRFSPAELDPHWYRDGVLAKQQKKQEDLIKSIHLQGDMEIRQDNTVIFKLHADKKDQIKKNDTINLPSLTLYAVHASQPEFDRRVELKRVKEGEYQGSVNSSLSGKYSLMVSENSDKWYLMSDAYFPQSGHLTFTSS